MITPLDFMDALMHAPFDGATFLKLKTINIRETPAQLQRWLVAEKSDYTGGWTKRFSKYVKKEFGFNLSTEPLSVMGELLAKAVKTATIPITLEFTDHADWKPGKFGDSGSCWWGDQKKSRIGLLRNGGGAICIYYADEKPRGRLWYFPLSHGKFSVIFNIYDKEDDLTILGISRILAMKYGVSYMRAYSLNFPESYLNGEGSGYLVGSEIEDRPITLTFARQKLSASDVSGFLPFDMDIGDTKITLPPHAVVEDKHDSCHRCNCDLDEDDVYHDPDRNIYCSDCYWEVYFSCYYCNEDDLRDEACSNPDGDLCCQTCFDDRFETCEDCDEVYAKEDLSWMEGAERSVCQGCQENNYFYCEDCQKDYHQNDANSTIAGAVCDDCFTNYTECDHCHEYEHDDNIGDVNVEDGTEEWCEVCRDRHATHCNECHHWYSNDDGHCECEVEEE